ncbi:MAG: nuclear transport factor 2 family protein [Gemmobacter sp.]
MIGAEIDAVRAVVVDYLEGMIWGQTDRIERAFHPRAIQVGHFAGDYEFLSRQEFVDWLKAEPSEPVGSPYVAEVLSIEVTGDVAVVRISDTCFGTEFTDYLVMVRHDGQWQIVTKAYFAHSGRGAS